MQDYIDLHRKINSMSQDYLIARDEGNLELALELSILIEWYANQLIKATRQAINQPL